MSERQLVKAKVVLIGEAAVGKTSLVNRFVYGTYDGRYLPTLVGRVTKKEVALLFGDTEVDVVLTIWDIMGEPEFLPLLSDAWFARAQGVLAVGDLSRPETFPALDRWLQSVRRQSGEIPALLVANKVDLEQADVVAAATFAEARGLAWTRTSAKTGKNVDAVFRNLAGMLVRAALPSVQGPARHLAEAVRTDYEIVHE